MCGIIGYIGREEATPILLEGLRRMEYRGYDSAGIAIINGKGLHIAKLPGRIQGLEDLVQSDPPTGTIGLAHTRWATHGPPTQINAHPHTCCKDRIAVVHNGIIENAGALRERLAERGHVFKSETDTEVVAHLIEEEYEGDLGDAVRAALRHVEGTYGLVVLSQDSPNEIVAARMGSPLLVGINDGELFVASDAAAIVGHTRRVIYLDDGEMVTLSRSGYLMRDLENTHVDKTIDEISWDLKEIEKGGYPHFMLKEIYEQPRAAADTMRGRVQPEGGTVVLPDVQLDPDVMAGIQRIVLVACGTSYHAAIVGRFMIERLTGIAAEVDLGSEFRYRDPLVEKDDLFITISQSGETADTLAAARHSPQLEIFRKKGIEVLLLSDRVDEWVVGSLTEFEGKKLVSVARGDLDLGTLADEEDKLAKEQAGESTALVEAVKKALGERVQDVRLTYRLTESPACLVADQHAMSANLERLLKAAGHQVPGSRPILEINPKHPLVERMKDEIGKERFADWASLLFEQALLAEGGSLEDPGSFVKRLNQLMLELAGAASTVVLAVGTEGDRRDDVIALHHFPVYTG